MTLLRAGFRVDVFGCAGEISKRETKKSSKGDNTYREESHVKLAQVAWSEGLIWFVDVDQAEEGARRRGGKSPGRGGITEEDVLTGVQREEETSRSDHSCKKGGKRGAKNVAHTKLLRTYVCSARRREKIDWADALSACLLRSAATVVVFRLRQGWCKNAGNRGG